MTYYFSHYSDLSKLRAIWSGLTSDTKIKMFMSVFISYFEHFWFKLYSIIDLSSYK